jgi:membrane protease YdiL (CAAX protease family)
MTGQTHHPARATEPALKPLPLKTSWLFFAIPALVLVIAVYWGIPALVSMGQPPFTAYMIALLVPLVIMLAASLVAYRMEGRPLTWTDLAERFRLRPMSRKEWLWIFVGFLAGGAGMTILAPVGRALVERGLLPLPDSIPAVLNPSVPLTDLSTFASLMGERAVGNWWLVVLAVVLLFFNIVGEEFWWRGYILPRQELAHGRWTWLIHGTMWTLFHAFKYWDWLGLLPVSLLISYIAQRRRNTWPGIVIHLLVNSMILVPVLLVVLGIDL